MEHNIIWTCAYCHINFSAQSGRKCPRCRRKLIPWDPSKDPLERQPEWPSPVGKAEASVDKEVNRIDYTKFLIRTVVVSN